MLVKGDFVGIAARAEMSRMGKMPSLRPIGGRLSRSAISGKVDPLALASCKPASSSDHTCSQFLALGR